MSYNTLNLVEEVMTLAATISTDIECGSRGARNRRSLRDMVFRAGGEGLELI